MNRTATPFQISDLRTEPGFLAIVGERLWQAWWKEDGHTLEDVLTLLEDSLRSKPIPTTLVAHAGERFMGTVSLIVSDMDERVQYSPGWRRCGWRPRAAMTASGRHYSQPECRKRKLRVSSGSIYVLSRKSRRTTGGLAGSRSRLTLGG